MQTVTNNPKTAQEKKNTVASNIEIKAERWGHPKRCHDVHCVEDQQLTREPISSCKSSYSIYKKLRVTK